MQLLNPVLIYGLAFAAIPIVLHLLMRTKPKKIVFPALRLIRQKRLQNVRRIRLRHFWLLLLRMLALAGLVLVVIRPSLPAANYSLNLRETLTLAGGTGLLLTLYFGLLRRWQFQRLSTVALASRRTFLRGGLGMLGALLFLLLFAWPYGSRIKAELTGPIQEVAPDVPVAAVFVFDTSLSMDYREENRTRLELARATALQQLETLPPRSRVAIADSASSEPILFQADLSGARARIEALTTSPRSLPLNDRLRAAVQFQEADRQRTLNAQPEGPGRSEQFAREIYLLTDLARSAWQPGSAAMLRADLEQFPQAGLYLIDVGVEQPRNMALTGLMLSKQAVTTEGEVLVEASLTAKNLPPGDATVELYVEGEAGQPVKQGVSLVKLTDEAGSRLQFAVKASGTKPLRGELRLAATDPLPVDNSLWFTVGVQEPIRILVSAPAAGDQPKNVSGSDANELVETLRVLGHAPRFVPSNRIEQTDLAAFDVLCLVNVPAPTAEFWQKLTAFVARGGGLLLSLGSAEVWSASGIQSIAWNAPAAREILPGELVAALRFDPPQGLDVRQTTHPLLQKFDAQGLIAEAATIPVWRYWKVEPAENATVIARFTDREGRPALLERPHGRGRTLMLTTAAHLSLDLREQWSRLAGEWPFLMLMDRTMLYLSHRSEAVFNHSAGETVLIPLEGREPLRRYLLRKPRGAQLPGQVDAAAPLLTITDTDELGQYDVRPVEGETAPAVFSVNAPAAESDFARMTGAELDTLLGEKRYSLSRNLETLQRSVTTGRLGVEVFPHLLAVMIVIFCLEHLAAVRFYESDTAPA